RARDVQRQVAQTGQADEVVDRQIPARGQPHVGVVCDAAGGRARQGRVGDRAHRQGIGVPVANRVQVIGRDRRYVVGAVVQVDGAAAQELQARSANGGRLGDRARDVQRQVAQTGQADEVVDRQIPATGQPPLGRVL